MKWPKSEIFNTKTKNNVGDVFSKNYHTSAMFAYHEPLRKSSVAPRMKTATPTWLMFIIT